jgi:ABC-type polysaccharide/polyol phosphate export permease
MCAKFAGMFMILPPVIRTMESLPEPLLRIFRKPGIAPPAESAKTALLKNKLKNFFNICKGASFTMLLFFAGSVAAAGWQTHAIKARRFS